MVDGEVRRRGKWKDLLEEVHPYLYCAMFTDSSLVCVRPP